VKLSSIHVKSLAINASNISTTTINGQEHYVIRGAVPIVDDIVMNGGLYPAEEINNSYQTMERKLMPIGHPMVNGKYVSANDPQAVNDYYAGAWAQNVSKANDKVVMDVYVNKAVADTKPDGKRLIQRLDDMISGNNADPIHVSTGLLLNKEQKAGSRSRRNTPGSLTTCSSTTSRSCSTSLAPGRRMKVSACSSTLTGKRLMLKRRASSMPPTA
jgi:hypothetical protein